MAKFGKSVDEEPTPPVERVVPPKPVAIAPAPTPNPTPAPAYMPPPQVTIIDNNNGGNSQMAQATVQMQMQTAQVQAQAQVGTAEVNLDKELLDQQLKKEDEHWMKAYWRPAMGWLYMLMCFCDFIAFPIISIFVPVITKMPYVAWQSLTLSNGGLIHLSFGAILGVTAYGRTQEKITK
jgi:uncharacterized membrane protein